MTQHILLALVLASTSASSQDTLVWGTRIADLTGDGIPETLMLVEAETGSVTFVIENEGGTLYRTEISVPFRSQAARTEFVESFFADDRFRSFDAFLEELISWGARFVRDIPDAIGREHRRQLITDSLVAAGTSWPEAERAARLGSPGPRDTDAARQIWADISAAAPSVFTFSTGGDAVSALAWSPLQRRFFNLVECC